MTFFKQSAALLLGFVLMAASAFAQGNMQQQMQQTQPDSISDDELKKFASVTSDVNEKIDAELSSLLKDKDMDQARFEEIMMSQQNPQAGDSVKMTDQEQETLNEVQPKLQKLQQQEIMAAMKNNGLQPQRFQAIVRALQSNPDIVKRYQKIVQEEQAQTEQN